VEVVDGAPTLADLELVGRGYCCRDIGLGLGKRLAKRDALGELGGGGCGQRAARPMGIWGLRARRLEPHRSFSVGENVDRQWASGMASFY